MSGSKRRPWTRNELILAINLYCKTPFGKIHVRNPDIIQLAFNLGRTPGSISYKLANFAAIDESLPRKGASNVSRLDREVWNEFFENWNEMAYESEKRAKELMGTHPEAQQNSDMFPEGKSGKAVVKTRINQDFFRKMMLASYEGTCCITGLAVPELLVASHIVPWAVDSKNRVNPRNGLCLNALHDRAFDKGLMTIDDSFHVLLSPRIFDGRYQKVPLIKEYDGVHIKMPKRFIPDQSFLAYHREHIFLG